MGIKGHTNNPKGRPKGIPNKATTDLRERMKQFLDDNFDLIEMDFKKLSPERRVALFEKYAKFILPSLQASRVDISIDKMSEEQVSDLLNRLIKKGDTNEEN